MTVALRPSFKSVLLPSMLLVAVLWLWWRLIDQLHLEWTVNPQYAYGWALPVLCTYLLWRRLRADSEKLKTETLESVRGGEDRVRAVRTPPRRSSIFHLVLLGCAALLYLPTRLVQEANPDWRFVSWALALEVITITLVILGSTEILKTETWKSGNSGSPLTGCEASGIGCQRFRSWPHAFPLLFFLVAVPWPTVIEGPLIQALTRANAGMTIELLNSRGLPALQRGNVIEISTGLVGIDDACSGIRSFQATLMISLFLGELYALSRWRRGLLVLSGFTLAFIFNVGRTLVLVTVAAKKGVPAISQWHDPAGVTILVACFLSLWLLGLWLAHRESKMLQTETRKADPTPEATAAPSQRSTPDHQRSTTNAPSGFRPFSISAFSLCAWLLTVELGTEFWYRSHERELSSAVDWHAAPPGPEAGAKELPMSENARRFLRYDSGRNVAWHEADGSRWQMIFLCWNGGRVAAHLARGHTPEVCLTAAGHELTSVSEVKLFTVHGVTLPFRLYSFQNQDETLFVFYCLREDQARGDAFTTESLTYASRWGAVWAGRRNLGQRSLEVAIWGLADATTAEAALQKHLAAIITVKPR